MKLGKEEIGLLCVFFVLIGFLFGVVLFHGADCAPKTYAKEPTPNPANPDFCIVQAACKGVEKSFGNLSDAEDWLRSRGC